MRGRPPVSLPTWACTARTGIFILAWVVVSFCAQAQDSDSVERAIKATYLFKFAAYVEWPATAFSSPTAPLVICIVGDDPFGDALDRAVSGERDGDRPIALRRMERATDGAGGCHILYAAGSETNSVADILAAVRGAPVLTVADAAGNPHSSAIVQFVIVDHRVRFAIDEAQAARSGLAISSKLLSLAVTIGARS